MQVPLFGFPGVAGPEISPTVDHIRAGIEFVLLDPNYRDLFATDAWYLTSIQAGFEPWSGGVGLSVDSFDASVN